MKTTERFTNAVTKLYNAFHNGTLNTMSPCACAVGSIVGNDRWIENFIYRPFARRSDEMSDKFNIDIQKTGYSQKELQYVEKIFIETVHPDETTYNNETKDRQFKGLCAVVEYLCELDGIPNVIDYTCLFETENEKPKYELSF